MTSLARYVQYLFNL
jgi:hypothetical protein